MRKSLFFGILLSLFSIMAAAQDSGEDELIAYQYYQQGDYEKAAVLFEKLFDAKNDDGYFELYFTSLLKIKQYDDAEKKAQKLIQQYPDKLQYPLALGRVFLETGRTEQAQKTFLGIIEKMPANEFSIRDLANQFYRFEAYDMAEKAFIKGRKLLNDEQAFVFELISLYRFKRDKASLVNECLNALGSTPSILLQVQNAFGAVFDDNSDYQLLQSAIMKKLQKQPDNPGFNQLLIWQFLQQKAYDMAVRQLIALDKRTNEQDALVYNTAVTIAANKDYATAIKAYQYLVEKGAKSTYYLAARIQLVNSKFELALTGKYQDLEIHLLADEFKQITDEFGKNSQTLFALQRWAYLQAYYLNDFKKAEQGLEECLSITGISPFEVARLKLELGDIYILTQQPWEAFLIYEQVARQYETQSIGNDAKFRAVRLSYFQGDFKYAKSQADVLKASTSQLMANDALNLSLLISDNLQSAKDSLALVMYAEAEMIQFKNKPELALAKLDSIPLRYPHNNLEDDILMAKAQIFNKTNEFVKAAECLQQLTDNFHDSLWADDALFMLAGLMEAKFNEPEKAKALYQRLITEYPDSILTAEARVRFRNLRGDNLGT